MQAASIDSVEQGDALLLVAGGRWDLGSAAGLDAKLARIGAGRHRTIRIDIGRVESLDTAGAWLLLRTMRRLEGEGIQVELAGASDAHAALLRRVGQVEIPPAPPRLSPGLRGRVEALGAGTLSGLRQVRDFVGFFGLVLTTLAASLMQPRRLRLTPLVYHMQAAGLNAMPIIGLISFLIGIVLAYQGAAQLRQFGAEIFAVDLIALSVLRELGILLTAIVVAGRSGSAFTAQIGSMKVREEIDAMRTLGIDPVEALVLPRVLALILTLPLLGFFADLMGLLGGGVMTWLVLGISPAVFLERLATLGEWHYLVGLIKAPFFALLVSLIGCYEGLQVTGSAESVGQRTTRSVVESIFLVIIADAAFSIFFNLVGV